MPISKTKDKLIDVARKLFAQKGVENTTMNDIAIASGFGRRTLYTYFDSKEERESFVYSPKKKKKEIIEDNYEDSDYEPNWIEAF